MIEKPSDLDKVQRASENRNAASFLVGFLFFCLAVAVVHFAFFTWAIELACAVIYVAIFMFAFSVKDYSPDSPSLYWGTGFLFTFIVEAVGFYSAASSHSPDFRLLPSGSFFWVSAQWFQAFAFLVVLKRNSPRTSFWLIVLTNTIVAAVLVSFYLLFPGVIFLLATRYHGTYLVANAIAISLLYGYMLAHLAAHWNKEPEYFAVRTSVSIGFSIAAVLGLALFCDAGPVGFFVFSYLRFVALALCYNANVTFILHSPYRALYAKLVTHAEQLSETNLIVSDALAEKDKLLAELQNKIRNNTELTETLELLHSTQDRLVETAKLSAAGQLIAGISHDLNTPLAAILSSSRMLETLIGERRESIAADWAALDPDQRSFFKQALNELVSNPEFLDSRSEHAVRSRWNSMARASGRPNAEKAAHLLVQIGLGRQEKLFQQLLGLEDPMPVVEALEPLATIYQLSTVIEHASERASNVVEALQNFLRSGSEGDKQLLDVETSIRRVLPLFQPHLRRGLKLAAQLQEAWVSAWPEKLTQVWVNLITNAVQAAGPQGQVSVTMALHGDQVAIAVENNGPGIPQEIQERIFDMFFTTKSAGEGTGLGLYVCRRIVDELDGQLDWESEPDRTVFTVSLPLEERIVNP